jgi:hypothetical protein
LFSHQNECCDKVYLQNENENEKIEVAQNCFSSHIQSVHAKQNVGFKSISTLLSFFIKMSLKCSQIKPYER